MARLRKVSGREAVKALSKLGFKPVRQRGSHVVMKKIAGGEESGCVIPLHDELKIGTLKGLLKQAKVSDEEFIEAL